MLYNTGESSIWGYFIGCFMMNEIEEKLSLALSEIIDERGINIVNINISNMSRNPDIQIIIDSTTGVSLDDCTFVSKITNDIVKLNNYFDDYDLEVSSPGINRQLFNLNDYDLYKNFKIKIKLKKSINNQKNFLGIIKGTSGENIIIAVDDIDIEIDFNNIKKANIQEI